MDSGIDPTRIRRFAGAVEHLGYDHLVVYDHVLGADPDRPGGWNRPGGWRSHGPYTHRTLMHEPFVLYGYLAAATRMLELAVAVLVLPQRPAALVAKQAAELDILSEGRLRLGVGIGWNEVEFEALGQSFRDRASRFEEQIELIRALWTNDVVTFEGRWHTVHAAGINPMPLRRPIPLWMGGEADQALRRIARLCDGWFMQAGDPEEREQKLRQFRSYVVEAGRSASDIGIEAIVETAGSGVATDWARTALRYAAMGVTHIYLSTLGPTRVDLDEHLRMLREFMSAIRG
jgi:probable F420-dependent oxidoreductase